MIDEYWYRGLMLRPYQQEARLKRCHKCNTKKDISLFGKYSASKDGCRDICKDCRKIETSNRKEEIKLYNKIYYFKNKKKENTRSKTYKDKNKDTLKEKNKDRYYKNQNERLKYAKKYRDKNKNKVIEATKKWREKNKTKIYLYNKEYKNKNRDKINAKYREYIKNRIKQDNDFCIKTMIRSSFKNIFKNNWRHHFKLTGYKYSDYIEYFEKTQKHLFILYKYTNDYHIDHIIPVSKYNFNKKKDIKKCWNPRNLRFITAKENMSKKDIIDFDLIIRYNIYDLLPEGFGYEQYSA